MKIASIEAIPVRIPLIAEHRMITALGNHGVSKFVVVRLTTDTGLVGAGEATVILRWRGETVRGAHRHAIGAASVHPVQNQAMQMSVEE